MSGSQSKTDLPQFTGLRGLAALLVLFFHIRTPQNLELDFGLLNAFSEHGYIGVDVFFVLSGFVLSLVYGDLFSSGPITTAMAKYGIARFSRVYPLHFVTLFMMLGAYMVSVRSGVTPVETGGYNWSSVILSLFLVDKWFGVVAPNPSSWSISIEMASYILFPFFIGRVLALRGLWPLAFIAAGAFAVEYLESMRVLRSIVEFAMGCGAYALALNTPARPLTALTAVVFAAPFVTAQAIGHELPGFSALCFAVTVFLISGAETRDPFKFLCSWRPLVFVGEISYSVYLLQWFVWVGWKHVLAKLSFFPAHPYVMVACAAASLLLCATVSFHFFERPMRSLIRRYCGTAAFIRESPQLSRV